VALAGGVLACAGGGGVGGGGNSDLRGPGLPQTPREAGGTQPVAQRGLHPALWHPGAAE
jgi:hypothetical protein